MQLIIARTTALFCLLTLPGLAPAFIACSTPTAPRPPRSAVGSQPTPGGADAAPARSPLSSAGGVEAIKTPGVNENSMTTPDKDPDVDFQASLRVVDGSRVVVNYRVTNRSRKTLLLFNRGDTELGLEAGRAYVEPRADGVVEIALRSFLPPKDRRCPAREVPIYPGVTRLRPKQSVSEEVAVALPLQLRSPYADCAPAPAMPDPVTRVKFCLGIMDAANVKTATEGRTLIVQSLQSLARQRLLCTDAQEIR